MTDVTRETLDELPVDSVALDADDTAWQKGLFGDWHSSDARVTPAVLVREYGPIRILLTPEQHEAGVREAVVKARAEVLRDAADDVIGENPQWGWTAGNVSLWLHRRADEETGT